MPPDAGRGSRRIVRGACPHDCPDTCAMLVTVEDGRAIAIRGAPDHPPTQGVLCTKVARYLERTYSRPSACSIRCAASGARARAASSASAGTRRSTTIAERFRAHRAVRRRAPGDPAVQLRRHHGPACSTRSMDRRFFHRLGASLLDRTICATAGKAGWAAVIGAVDRHGPRAVRRQPADRDLGQQPDHVEPALLDARAGSQAARREARRDRSVPQRHRREVPRAHRADARHRRRARARRSCTC